MLHDPQGFETCDRCLHKFPVMGTFPVSGKVLQMFFTSTFLMQQMKCTANVFHIFYYFAF